MTNPLQPRTVHLGPGRWRFYELGRVFINDEGDIVPLGPGHLPTITFDQGARLLTNPSLIR